MSLPEITDGNRTYRCGTSSQLTPQVECPSFQGLLALCFWRQISLRLLYPLDLVEFGQWKAQQGSESRRGEAEAEVLIHWLPVWQATAWQWPLFPLLQFQLPCLTASAWANNSFPGCFPCRLPLPDHKSSECSKEKWKCGGFYVCR